MTKQNKTGSIIANCYLVDHIAKDHVHTDIKSNTEEPKQKYRIGTVSKRLRRGGVGGGGGQKNICIRTHSNI